MIETESLNHKIKVAGTARQPSNIEAYHDSFIMRVNGVFVYSNGKKNDYLFDLMQSEADNYGITVVTEDSFFVSNNPLDVNYFASKGKSARLIYKSLIISPAKTSDLVKLVGMSQPAVNASISDMLRAGILVKDYDMILINPKRSWVVYNGIN